ncbi:MAG: hypothetical protein ABI821_15880 [Pseudomonadota bacterium]
MSPRASHRRLILPGALFLMSVGTAAQAVDAIVLEVREVTVAGMPVTGANVRLNLLSDKQTSLTIAARAATLPDPVGKLTDLTLVCPRPVIADPRFGCEAGRLTGRGGPTGVLDMNVAAEMRIDTGVTTFSGRDLKIAGTAASFNGRMDAKGWQVKAQTGTTNIPALRKFAKPWFDLPADLTVDGKVTLEMAAEDSGKGTVADIGMKLEGVDLTNEASTVVGEKVNAHARVRASLRDKSTGLDVKLTGTQGQTLLGPILLDLAKNSLTLEMRGNLVGDVLDIDALHYTQADLIDVAGAGRVNLAGDTPLVSGAFKLAKLRFPAAYTSFIQITLASSLLGDLTSGGSLSGEFSVADNAVTSLHVLPRDLELHDRKGRLDLSKVNGDVHWAPAGGVEARVSTLSWSSGGAYGLSGGAAELQFVAYGMNFALTRPTKLPIFDGALAIDHLALGNLGADNMEVAFKGAVEPISMQKLAKAFGWPEFSGTLAAAIPGVTLRNNVLTFDGNVESQVFGGSIVGSNIRLQDPLGNFPQFFADVRARNLDLGLVTQTFEVGTITGKLEADVLGLELFAWTPQKFDARLATPKGDKSRHRISAKAVSSLSNVGGGGGGVVQALQSGVLKFFDEYSYDKLGITCKLRGDVCEMSGVEPAGVGYYIVKGAGVPRIDIVGNAGRVNWSQLMSSISTAEFGDASVQ